MDIRRTSSRFERPLGPAYAFVRRHFSALLMVVGALTLAYVTSQYYSMWHEQKVLAAEWRQQNEARARQSRAGASQGTSQQASATDGLTRIEIPKIDVDAIVVEGSGRKQLKVGPGRVSSTSQPGEPGNAVITAHRDTFFRHVYELVKGDDILVRRNGQLYRFQVTGKKIVDPSDVSVLKATPDAELTLITCYPTYYIGPAPQRLVVSSKLVESRPDVAMTAEAR